jgi:hypothetical protein
MSTEYAKRAQAPGSCDEYPAESREAAAIRAMPADIVHRVVRVVRMEDGSAEVSSWR